MDFPDYDESVKRIAFIGNISVQWAHLEYLIAVTIWRILHLDPDTGKIVTGGLDMLPRINMALNLARHLKAKRALINRLVSTRKAIQDGLDVRRNRAIHGVGFYNPATRVTSVEVHRGKGDRKPSALPNSELRSLGTEINQLGKELNATLSELDMLSPYIASLPIIAAKMRPAAADTGSQSGS